MGMMIMVFSFPPKKEKKTKVGRTLKVELDNKRGNNEAKNDSLGAKEHGKS